MPCLGFLSQGNDHETQAFLARRRWAWSAVAVLFKKHHVVPVAVLLVDAIHDPSATWTIFLDLHMTPACSEWSGTTSLTQ